MNWNMSDNNIPGPHIDDELKWKAKVFIAFVFLLFTLLLLRLMSMQVFKGSYYEGLARNNRVRIVSIPAQRGKILDRNLEVLADNRPAYNLMVMPEDIPDVDAIAHRLARILESDEEELAGKIREAKKRPYNPVALARDISFHQMAAIETQLYTMPGISIDATSERDYVLKELGAHILGFLGEISRKQLESLGRGSIYAPGDLIGKAGIESICEQTLRGTKGCGSSRSMHWGEGQGARRTPSGPGPGRGYHHRPEDPARRLPGAGGTGRGGGGHGPVHGRCPCHGLFAQL